MTSPDILPLGRHPSPGELPLRMHAQVIRPERYGEPLRAFQAEEIETPRPRPGEVVVAVMAAGINYNNVWASLGYPLDVIAARNRAGENERFHIGGSEASGIVQAVGEGVRSVRPGDEVVVHGGVWDPADPWVRAGKDPMLAPTQKAWGYETNWGAFAQYCRVWEHQCLSKPADLGWAEAASYILSGATAYRMLRSRPGHRVRPGDVVLVWGGAGGLGVMAVQLVREAGGIPIAVTNSPEKGAVCRELGAEGVLNRAEFPELFSARANELYATDHGAWRERANSFREALLSISRGRLPRLVFEHPGESTMPVSEHACAPGGMIVICAGTTGYNARVHLGDFCRGQKRLQGSHFANGDDCRALNELVRAGRIKPVLSRVFAFAETGAAHQLMMENRHPPGNMAVLIGAPEEDAQAGPG